MKKIELALEVLDRAKVIPLTLTDKAVNIIEKELDCEEKEEDINGVESFILGVCF